MDIRDAETKAPDLWRAYRAWVDTTKVRYPLGSKKFYQSIGKRYAKKVQNDGAWYVGIKLNPPPPPVASGAAEAET